MNLICRIINAKSKIPIFKQNCLIVIPNPKPNVSRSCRNLVKQDIIAIIRGQKIIGVWIGT